MRKYQLFIILMVFTLFISFTIPKAEASTLPDFNTVKKMTRAVGEKMGIKWSIASLGAVAGSIIQDADFWGNFGSIPDTIDEKKVLSSDQFKSYLGEINTTLGKETVGTTLPLYGGCGGSPISGVLNGTGLDDYYVYKQNGYYWVYAWVSHSGVRANVTASVDANGYFLDFVADQPIGWSIKRTDSLTYDSTFTWNSAIYINNGSANAGAVINVGSPSWGTPVVVFNSQQTVCNYTIASTDVPDTSIVDPRLTDPTTVTNYNYYTNYTINYPSASTDGTDGLDKPWNDPLTPEQLGNIAPSNPEPTDKPTGSSWWAWLLKPLFDFLSGITDLFSKLFVPDGDSITNQFADLSDSFKAKLPISGQLGDFWGGLKGAVTDGQKVPKFDISFPKDWGGGTYSIIDFSYFTDYRTWILNFIRFSAWFLFLKRLYNKIASLI